MNWTHLACENCWHILNGENRQPVRAVDPRGSYCCFCGAETTSGIYVRHHPKGLKCEAIPEGEHP